MGLYEWYAYGMFTTSKTIKNPFDEILEVFYEQIGVPEKQKGVFMYLRKTYRSSPPRNKEKTSEYKWYKVSSSTYSDDVTLTEFNDSS